LRDLGSLFASNRLDRQPPSFRRPSNPVNPRQSSTTPAPTSDTRAMALQTSRQPEIPYAEYPRASLNRTGCGARQDDLQVFKWMKAIAKKGHCAEKSIGRTANSPCCVRWPCPGVVEESLVRAANVAVQYHGDESALTPAKRGCREPALGSVRRRCQRPRGSRP